MARFGEKKVVECGEACPRGPAADRVQAMLAQACEGIAFDLKLSHAQVLIHAEGSGWMAPQGNEVEFILPDDEA